MFCVPYRTKTRLLICMAINAQVHERDALMSTKFKMRISPIELRQKLMFFRFAELAAIVSDFGHIPTLEGN